MPHKPIPPEALIDLRRRLDTLPPRSPERRRIIQETATLYSVSEYTLYRVLRASARPRALQRSDSGLPRILPKPELERYCEIIAAIKLRTWGSSHIPRKGSFQKELRAEKQRVFAISHHFRSYSSST